MIRIFPLKTALRWIALVIGAVAVLAGSYFHIIDSYELETLDLRFRLRPPIPVTDKIAIIEIGEDTIAKLGRFPFDRSFHTIVVKALSASGARAIIFDLFFSEPTGSDPELAAAIRASGNVYFPYVFQLEKMRPSGIPESDGYVAENIDMIDSAAKGTGHINVVPDIDGKFRRIPAYVRYNGRDYPYITLKAGLDYLGIPQKDISIKAGDRITAEGRLQLPLDEDSLLIVNFSGPWGASYRHYSYVDIVQSYLAGLGGKRANIDLSELKDKVCIIGLTATGTVDLHPNPFDTLYPAVGMHAEVFNSLLNGRFIRRSSRETNMVILAALVGLVSLLVLKTKPLRGLFILFSAVSLYSLVAVLIFSLFGIWLDVVYPVLIVVLVHLSLTLYKYVREWRQRLLMENELGIAKKIQESFLPKSMPDMEGIDISAVMFTARQVGGDLYDFVQFGEEPARKFGVMAGDVSGKGVPAALFMAMTVGAFRSFAVPQARPGEVLANLNAKLVKESASNLFVTIFYMIFDLENGSALYGNGGHLPVLYMPESGRTRYLDVTDGAPLGLMEGPYSGGSVDIGRGDIFVFYTDGITEAMNPRSDMYGKERLQAACEKNRSLDASALAAAIEKDVRRFEPKNRQHDDMTVIVVKIT